ncbi:hypothetical protein PanWU01x14_140130 [Parasponia andersonii]|uniref:Transmembrane protein n=1 Tax=Parasponia andersonii TaxID=3476 RepID=A0A2P5CMA8_PARAD|nr:hypothetical protein PanWU01x14_140130 [Parasponia andersonii]
MSFSVCLRFLTLFVLIAAAMFATPHHLVYAGHHMVLNMHVFADLRRSNNRKLGRAPSDPVKLSSPNPGDRRG